ncbi:hypothetical protein GLOIN_2v1648429 [Rhizophagus irregularis DAOM 181602=DAOM 197198]|uniref:Uncharacterized protein n=1 Tax=Rhizophagus irregularis (strain DAOM 181602 / DAOM 197198 / MUCL 43194) TaxID=747089 RepID=A0A2P4PPP4_RHIID|nr:hypothetical protein GLOIN_2v1648429 [Rhizophagus irregularis DAOM 181602=DAOM 197198]POG67355.1 hypothetical protein GLOIN_2v1648429 [Rhizophagus irregularis DAOM 181602=DAOM 197198]GET59639.1 hypothetical protein GLOIN_2v1648429 [Rhizophagus irregularis DAOM 181602=DAOM 197198]|eukprot:XP_025174221.1 hypothetical protein GLOIN_2v1648429 [Rhizophagus irregularis DAOM 181602=DAOM 197198]
MQLLNINIYKSITNNNKRTNKQVKPNLIRNYYFNKKKELSKTNSVIKCYIYETKIRLILTFKMVEIVKINLTLAFQKSK